MAGAFDYVGGLRLVRVQILIDGKYTTFEDVDIRIQGAKYYSIISNWCTVRISNMTQDQRHWLLTNTSPVQHPSADRTPTFLAVDVGREKNGYFRLFEGVVYSADVTPPPDIGITFRSLVGSGISSKLGANSLNAVTTLSDMAKSIASQCSSAYPKGLILDFQATDKSIANYTFI